MDEPVYAPQVDYSNTVPPVESKGIGSHIIDFIQTLVVFGAIFAIIYLFIAQPHKVSGSSMFPNFENGDYILTDKLSYRFSEPKRGTVIVLKNPNDLSQDFIKRIIAVPGDTVMIKNSVVYVNNSPIEEPYLPAGTITHGETFLHEGETVKLAEGQYFVFGDNREHSSDSREWGEVPSQDIIGRVIFRYWPAKSFGLIPQP